jgi:hypothetical protein
MYKQKLFARHPRNMLKSKGSYKTYGRKSGSGRGSSSIDDYLLSLVKGVSNGMKLSKKGKHTGGAAVKKNYEGGGKCCSGGALKFVR